MKKVALYVFFSLLTVIVIITNVIGSDKSPFQKFYELSNPKKSWDTLTLQEKHKWTQLTTAFYESLGSTEVAAAPKIAPTSLAKSEVPIPKNVIVSDKSPAQKFYELSNPKKGWDTLTPQEKHKWTQWTTLFYKSLGTKGVATAPKIAPISLAKSEVPIPKVETPVISMVSEWNDIDRMDIIKDIMDPLIGPKDAVKGIIDPEFVFNDPMIVAIDLAIYTGETKPIERLLEKGANPISIINIKKFVDEEKAKGNEFPYNENKAILDAYERFRTKQKEAVIKEVANIPVIASLPHGIMRDIIAPSIDVD